MIQSDFSTIWQEHRSYLLNVLALLAVIAVPLVMIPPLITVCWHYLLCLVLVLASGLMKKMGMHRAVTGIAVLVCLAAVLGFFLVYQGPFMKSGKTFPMYVSRYGLFTLPIFLFPCIAVGIVMWKKNNNT